jgi:hypothetical protein
MSSSLLRLTLAKLFHENVPRSDLVVLDAGHCIFDDEPATTARAVAEFLASAAA